MTYFEERRRYSSSRLDELKDSLARLPEFGHFPELSVYATGSYARLEASPHSDLDVFLVHSGSEDELAGRNTRQIRLTAAVVTCVEELRFPEFSNDGEFLKILSWDATLNHLGGRADDYLNHFTARMLLLLESRPLVNDEKYKEILNKTIGAYFRDYADHADAFHPTFLVNDIIRFWKTLCLNYEYKRNQQALDERQRIKLKIKNFKLKHSRMLTCWATVIGLLTQEATITEEFVRNLVCLPPRERLRLVDGDGKTAEAKANIDNQYLWFLQKTALPQDELYTYFSSPAGEKEAFKNADEFGDAVYRLLTLTARRVSWLRYVVI